LQDKKKQHRTTQYIYISFFLFNFADKISQNNISPYLILQIYIPAFEKPIMIKKNTLQVEKVNSHIVTWLKTYAENAK
jgi:hypothetical protein